MAEFVQAIESAGFDEAGFRAALAVAKRAAPGTCLDETKLRSRVSEILAKHDIKSHAALMLDELWFAMALAKGDLQALSLFETRYEAVVKQAHSRARSNVLDPDELWQKLKVHVLVARPGLQPRIAGFEARGPLSAWLRLVASRIIVDEARRSQGRVIQESSSEFLDNIPSTSDDPELKFLKASSRSLFKAAFASAVSEMSPRERNILRHRFVDGLGVQEIANLYNQHRVSMSRALSRIQRELSENLRLKLTIQSSHKNNADDMLEFIQSHLDLSLSRLFSSQQLS